MEILVYEILGCIAWYIVGLVILGIFYYKVESSASTLEILGIMVCSLLGPLAIVVVIIYFIDTYGSNKIFRWRN